METKNVFQSKTIVGSLVALFALIISTFLGYEIDVVDKAQLTDVIIAMLGSLGALTAIYGRVVATKKIELNK